jgi:hypothetical protein
VKWIKAAHLQFLLGTLLSQAALMRSAFSVLSMVRLDDGIFDQAVKVHGTRAGHIGSARKAAEWLL